MNLIISDPLYQHPTFFDEGIRFECQQCGQCCVGEPGTIYVSESEIQTLAVHLQLSLDVFTTRYLYPFKDSYSICEDARGHCLFFDNGCTVYSKRPSQCRTFPFWFCNLRSERNWRRIERQCPGIGTGRRFTRGEIVNIVQDTLHF